MKLIKEKYVIYIIRPDTGKLYLTCINNDSVKYTFDSFYKFSSNVLQAIKFDTMDEASLVRDLVSDDMGLDLQVEKQLFTDDIKSEA